MQHAWADRKCKKYFSQRKPEGKILWEDLDINGVITKKWILENRDMKA
jgi:hypothetical protein